MALIRCPECGKEVSNKAKCCIHCGYPLESEGTAGLSEETECKAEDGETDQTENTTDTSQMGDESPVEDGSPIMITCPACGKSISAKSYECPECGHPVNEREEGASFGMVLVAVVLGIIICTLF